LRSTAAGVARFSIATDGGSYSSEMLGGSGQAINKALPATWLIPMFFISNANTANNQQGKAYYFSAYIPGNGQ
jgi:hypothetical protein